MNWARVRQIYLSAVGESQAAGNESLIHLSEAQRTIAARLPFQETESVETETATTASQDYVNLPSDLFHVLHVYEKVSGNELTPEEGGMRGRARYLAPTTGKPPTGATSQYYAIANGRLYLRPTPVDTAQTIVVRGRVALSDISESEMGDAPTLPEHYHMAIGIAAALSFLSIHPDALKQAGQEAFQALQLQLEDRLKAQDLPKERERFDNRGRMRLRGFRIGCH